jgi:hypothetical protein
VVAALSSKTIGKSPAGSARTVNAAARKARAWVLGAAPKSWQAVARQSGWRRQSEFEAAAGSEGMIMLIGELRKRFFSVPLFDCRCCR